MSHAVIAEQIDAEQKSWEESVLCVMRRLKKPIKDAKKLARLVCERRKAPYTLSGRGAAMDAITRMLGRYGATASLKIYPDGRIGLVENKTT